MGILDGIENYLPPKTREERTAKTWITAPKRPTRKLSRLESVNELKVKK